MTLAAVIIHYGDLNSTERFAHQSLERNPGVRFFLVNNGPDGDSAVQGVMPPEIQVIGPPMNRGYAGAANRGIEAAASLGYDDIVILPDDGEVPLGALLALRDEAEKMGATIAGPLVLYRDSRTIWAAGHQFSKVWGISRNFGKGDAWNEDMSTMNVDYVTGHAPLLRGVSERPWLRFDEDLFIYYEDISICDEVKARGESVILVPDVIVYHDKPGQVTYRFASTQEKHMARSGLIYWAKHTKGLQRASHLVGFLALTLYRFSRADGWGSLAAGLRGLSVGSRDAARILSGRPPKPARL